MIGERIHHPILFLCLSLFLSLGGSSVFASQNLCKKLLHPVNQAEYAWRKNFTHDLSGEAWITDAVREKQIQDSIKNMTDEHNGVFAGHPDTPPMVLIPVAGTKITFTQKWQEYSPMVAKVTGASDGVLRVTVLLPVSAHTGLADATRWAASDTYSLSIKYGNGAETTIVKDAKSLGMITTHEVEIPLKEGQPVTLFYYRSGSGGPGGYSGGRILEMTWDKKDPDVTPTDHSKPFWI